MEINKLDKTKAEREAKELQKKYAEQQKNKERWTKFKETYYWGMMMDELDRMIEEYRDITKAMPKMVSPKDFEELGKITAIRTEIYEGIKKIKTTFANK